MPAPIYLPEKPSLLKEMLPYYSQMIGMMHQRKMATEEDAFKPEVPESLKGKVGLIKTGRGKWQVVKIPEIEEKSIEQKLFQQGIVKAGNKYFKLTTDNEMIPLTKEEKDKLPYKVGTIKEFKEGDQIVYRIYTKEGKWEKTTLPGGPRYKPTTSVNVTVDTGMEKRTKAKLQEEILEHETSLAQLNQAEKLFKDEYLQLVGKKKGQIMKIGDQLGIPVDKKYLADYASWKGIVDTQTLAYRKMVTGVAGGEKEMKAIEKTYINTKYDSPTTFRAKLKMYQKNTQAAIDRKKAALAMFNKPWPQLTSDERQRIAELYPFAFEHEMSTPEQEANDFLKKRGL